MPRINLHAFTCSNTPPSMFAWPKSVHFRPFPIVSLTLRIRHNVCAKCGHRCILANQIPSTQGRKLPGDLINLFCSLLTNMDRWMDLFLLFWFKGLVTHWRRCDKVMRIGVKLYFHVKQLMDYDKFTKWVLTLTMYFFPFGFIYFIIYNSKLL